MQSIRFIRHSWVCNTAALWFTACRGRATYKKYMTKIKTHLYDAAVYLTSEEACALYLQTVVDESEGDPMMIVTALGEIARARGWWKTLTSAPARRFSHLCFATPAHIQPFNLSPDEAGFGMTNLRKMEYLGASISKAFRWRHPNGCKPFMLCNAGQYSCFQLVIPNGFM